MLISINIISAISIVMGLFIPYFILLHISNTLRKKVESSERDISIILKQIKVIESISNENFRGQDKNWELYKEDLTLTKEALSLFNENFKGMNENFEKIDKNFKSIDKTFDDIINEIDDLHKLVNQKQTLKEILENPIEVTKPACETKAKLKEEANETFTEIVNQKAFVFDRVVFGANLKFIRFNEKVELYNQQGILVTIYEGDLAQKIWAKVIQANEPKPKRKYRKRVTKEVANEAKRNLLKKN